MSDMASFGLRGATPSAALSLAHGGDALAAGGDGGDALHKLQRLASAKPGDRNGEADAVATKVFEELLLAQLLKAMRETVPEDEEADDGGFAMDTANGMFDAEIAKLTAGHLGLGAVLSRQLGPATPQATSDDPLATAARAAAWRRSAPSSSAAPAAAAWTGDARASWATHAEDGARARVGVAAASGLPSAGLWPVDGRISSSYGPRVHPIHGDHRFHAGLDIAAPEGTEIRAVAAGRVVAAERRGGYGLVVELEHADGSRTRYAHASRLHVQPGDRVEVGETIADVGTTGASTGPHLHFEARVDGRTVDPERYLARLRAAAAGPTVAGEAGTTRPPTR